MSDITGRLISVVSGFLTGYVIVKLWYMRKGEGKMVSLTGTLRPVFRLGLRVMRWIVRQSKASEFTPYQLPLAELIFRCENRHSLATGRKFTLCPYCETRMMFRHSKIVTEMGPVRDDQAWKCIKCFHTAHFGIPMTRELALAEVEVRGGPTLMRPTERPDEDGDAIVTERLRRLGYLE